MTGSWALSWFGKRATPSNPRNTSLPETDCCPPSIEALALSGRVCQWTACFTKPRKRPPPRRVLGLFPRSHARAGDLHAPICSETHAPVPAGLSLLLRHASMIRQTVAPSKEIETLLDLGSQKARVGFQPRPSLRRYSNCGESSRECHTSLFGAH
jgi:hypothetical protein